MNDKDNQNITSEFKILQDSKFDVRYIKDKNILEVMDYKNNENDEIELPIFDKSSMEDLYYFVCLAELGDKVEFIQWK